MESLPRIPASSQAMQAGERCSLLPHVSVPNSVREEPGEGVNLPTGGLQGWTPSLRMLGQKRAMHHRLIGFPATEIFSIL